MKNIKDSVKYLYTIEKVDSGVWIKLNKEDSKDFFLNGDRSVQYLDKHMYSLIKTQCGDWFKHQK